MTQQCVNCPGAEDHSTAQCPVMAEASAVVNQQVTAAASLPVGVPDGYMPIPTAEQLAEALENVRSFHDMSAELIAPELLANLLASTTVKAEQVPTPEFVWVRLLEALHGDNGGAFTASTDDYREAKPALVQLIAAGFFRDDADSLDGDIWAVAAGEQGEAAARFASCPDAYAVLSDVLNRVFDRPDEAPSLPAAGSTDLTAVRCQCYAAEYPHDSYDAGFIAGSGMCQVCDAAMPPKDLPAAGSAELIADAERCLFVMREIGSMDGDDITGDDVDLRFEDDEGRDTGCDVSIVEYAEKSADVIEKMIAALSSHAAGSADFPPPDFALDGGSQPCYYAETVQRIVAALSAQQSAPWAPSGADYDRAIHRNPDAKAWADFFIATFPGQADKHDLMLGWFANAMMAMHDHLKAQQSAHVSVPREWLDAVKELFDAKQAKEDFERENPGNSTKRWDACLYRIEAAEDALRALLNGGEA